MSHMGGNLNRKRRCCLEPKQQLKLRANCVEKLLLHLKYLILLILGGKSIKKIQLKVHCLGN